MSNGQLSELRDLEITLSAAYCIDERAALV